MLKIAFRDMKTVSPEALSNIAERAGVSIEALVRRVSDQNTLLASPYFAGCIILLKTTGKETTVTAIAKPHLVNIARDLRLMRPGRTLAIIVK